jgi:hypothetical protein
MEPKVSLKEDAAAASWAPAANGASNGLQLGLAV